MSKSRSQRKKGSRGACRIEDCKKERYRGDLCCGHYTRKRRTKREPSGELRHYRDPETAFQEAALNYGALRDEYFTSAADYANASAEDREAFHAAKSRLWMAGKRLFGRTEGQPPKQ